MECEAAKIKRGTTLNQELKRVANAARQSGKVKRLIIEMGAKLHEMPNL